MARVENDLDIYYEVGIQILKNKKMKLLQL